MTASYYMESNTVYYPTQEGSKLLLPSFFKVSNKVIKKKKPTILSGWKKYQEILFHEALKVHEIQIQSY